MTEIPMKMYWMGEDIDGLPRERLIEIICFQQQQVESMRKILNSTLEIHRAARAAQR